MGGKGSGRKAMPTALKLAMGNPGRRPLPADEPQPTALINTRPPAWLNADAQKVYQSAAKELVRLKILTVVDTELLAAYCEEWTTYRKAAHRLNEEGDVIFEIGRDGETRRVNPWHKVKKDALAAVQRLANEFGFSPRARVGLHLSMEEALKDPISEMAARHRDKRGTA